MKSFLQIVRASGKVGSWLHFGIPFTRKRAYCFLGIHRSVIREGYYVVLRLVLYQRTDNSNGQSANFNLREVNVEKALMTPVEVKQVLYALSLSYNIIRKQRDSPTILLVCL